METVKGPDSLEEKLERMVGLYQLPLLRLCYAYLHDEELAKDAVQETFIKAYRNLNRFDGKSSEKTWLNRIAINTCKDMCKSGWFRHMDRRITPDMLPETETRPEEKDESLTIAIMDLPANLKGWIPLPFGLSSVPHAGSCSSLPSKAKRSFLLARFKRLLTA